jgi:excisionase family DNA binding protein
MKKETHLRKAEEALRRAKQHRPPEQTRPMTPTNTSIKPHPSTMKGATMKKTPMQLAQQVTFTVAEAAKITGRSVKTIRRHAKSGRLKAAGGGRGTPYRISRPDLEAWWREQGGGRLFPDEGADEGADTDE